LAIAKCVRATLRFYNELRKEGLARGDSSQPPSFETFSNMAKGLMQASKQADLERLKNLSMKDPFERTWAQKLQNYSTQKLLRDAYETLVRRYSARSNLHPSAQ
jgi:hypothetical protein